MKIVEEDFPKTESAVDDLPFSHFLRILGKGPKTKRALTEEEASEAMRQFLSGKVTDRQLGAFLLLMRANGEAQSELKGFLKEIRNSFLIEQNGLGIDLDYSAYAGKWRYPPYFLLSIKLLNQAGYKVLLHGDHGQFLQRTYAEELLEPLGFIQAGSLSEATDLTQSGTLTYLPLDSFAPKLREILHLKEELGVRTVFNTIVKLLNPLNAPASIQGIFHPGVEKLHYAAAQCIGNGCNLVFKGEGGEPEIRPDALSKLYFSSLDSDLTELKIPSLIQRQERPKNWKNSDLVDLWLGKNDDIYGKSAVIATAAVAIMAIQLSRSASKSDVTTVNLPLYEKCFQKASLLWQKRSQSC